MCFHKADVMEGDHAAEIAEIERQMSVFAVIASRCENSGDAVPPRLDGAVFHKADA